MPTDSIKNVERAFTGRVPVVSLNNDSPVNQIFELINFKGIFEDLKPAGSIHPTFSIALETLQLISYLPGLFKPHKLPDYDEDLIPLLKRQTEDLEWMAEFNPVTNYALEITLFESFFIGNNWSSWQPIARKWLYNQQTEYYLDLINPFLTSKKQSDIGDPNYKLGVAITQKPTQQTTFANNNYLRFRCAYSGIISYEQGTVTKRLTKSSGNNPNLNLNTAVLTLSPNSQNRKIAYLQNTGLSIVYFNFESYLVGTLSPYLLPGETLSYESGSFKWSGGGSQFLPPLAEYLIQEGLYVWCEGKDKDGKLVNKNSVSWIEFLEV